VLMEYMACAKPVIASFNSGHMDILDKSNSLMLEQMKPFRLFDANDSTLLTADWSEPSIDEILEKLEYAYSHRAEIKQIGRQGGEHMKNLTWRHMAQSLLHTMGISV